MRSITKLGLTFLLVFCLSSVTFAQGTEANKAPIGPRRQMATIIFAGLGGAVLGLSTLSFYGRPQDKLANIAIGFAVGLITGTVVVTYKMASEPDQYYSSEYDIEPSYKISKYIEETKSEINLNLINYSF